MLGNQDFTVSEHRAPFKLPYSTALSTVNSHGAYRDDTYTLSSKMYGKQGNKKSNPPSPPPPTPPHSKLGCLLFPAGSSYNGISLFDGGGGAKNIVFSF